MTHPYDAGRRRGEDPDAVAEESSAGKEDPPRDAWEDRPRTRWADTEDDLPEVLAGGSNTRMRAVVPIAAGMMALAGVGAWLGLSGDEPAAGPAVSTPSISLMEVPGKELVFTPAPSATPSRTPRESSHAAETTRDQPPTRARTSTPPKPSTKPTPKPTRKPTPKPTKTRQPTKEPTTTPPSGTPEPTCDNWVDCHDLPPDS